MMNVAIFGTPKAFIMRHELHHINNASQKIVFRDEEDYTRAVNRLASCAFATRTEVWAFTVMSTHFHLVVGGPDIRRFIKSYSYSISRGHNHKYQANIHLKVSDRVLSNEFEITAALNYVLKNPVHHGVAETPFSYPYSSVGCYFPARLPNGRSSCVEMAGLRSMSVFELGGRESRCLFGHQRVPDSYRVSAKKMIVPESFVECSKVDFLYKSPRRFLYNMTKPLTEELEVFEDASAIADKALDRGSLFGKKTDIEVCGIIDSAISPRPYTRITESERGVLWKSVKRLGVDWHQFLRAT